MNMTNHHVWERLMRKNRMTAIFCTLIFVFTIISLFTGAARSVTVFYNNQCRMVNSFFTTPRVLMEKAGFSYDGQEYELEETADGVVLRVGEELNVSVSIDGTTHTTVTRTDRVSNILKNLGIVTDKYDVITPGGDTILTEDCDITVQRVSYVPALRAQSVEPNVVYEETDTLPVGALSVKDPGKAGTAYVTYKDKIVDGEIVESTPLAQMITKEPTDKILLKGTGDPKKFAPVVTTDVTLNTKLVSDLEPETPIAVNEKGQPLSYKKCITGLATAYTAADGKKTSTGVVADVGYIAVDPKEIPYGTMMYIKTADGSYHYGVAKAADTGGFISGPVAVDLFFNTEAECIQFGVRTVEIYIL